MTLSLPRISRCILPLALLTALTACGSLGIGSSKPTPLPAATPPAHVLSSIWNGGADGYVRIESQEITANRANQHPVTVTPQQLASVLSEIQIRQGNSSPRPLMNEAMARQLAEPLSRALAQADPSQDVTFAIVADVEGQSNVLSTETVTTGRMFYLDGRLNVVFGLIREYARNQDPSNYTPGQRATILSPNVKVMPATGILLADAARPDWVVVGSNAWPGPDGRVASTTSTQAPTGSVLSGTPVIPVPTVENAVVVAAPVAAAPVATAPVATAPVAPATTQGYYDSFEQRLATLRKLREQNLITEQEFRAKRQEILDQL